MIYTTLNRIHALCPSPAEWRDLLKSLNKTSADDEPLAFSEILKSNGLDSTLWCLKAEPQHHSLCRLYAVAQARKVQHLGGDPGVVEVLEMVEHFAKGEASEEELQKAGRNARVIYSKASDAACATPDAAICAAFVAADAAYCTTHGDANSAALCVAHCLATIEGASLTQDFEALLQKWEAAPGEAAVEIPPAEA